MIQKLILASAIGILSVASLNAQSAEGTDKLTAGIKAGLNISNVWDENDQEFQADSKVGFAGGVFFGIPIGQYLGVQPEILISQKGFQGSGTLLGFPYSTSRTTTFLDIPVQIQLKPSPFITVLAGPQFSYLLKQNDVFTFGDNSTEQQEEFTNDNIRKNILGFVGGFDVNYSHIVFSGRVGWDLQTNNGDGTSLTPRYKNRWFQFTLGVKI